MQEIALHEVKVEMKAVSVIIPAYNAERTIGECLSAIKNLVWDGEIEVIVVDDYVLYRRVLVHRRPAQRCYFPQA